MPHQTNIEWTDLASNPVRAERVSDGRRGWHCVKTSPGCAGCYAEAINRRFGTGLPYTAHGAGQARMALHEPELRALLRTKGPAKVFVGDMTDPFQEAVPDAML